MENLDKNQIRLRGRIIKIFYSSPIFTAGRILTSDNRNIPFAGKIFVNLDDQIILIGKYKKHEKYGYQFIVESVALDLTLDKYGLRRFLSNNKKIKNIGPAKAKKIVEKFGDNFEEVLLNHPEEIVRFAKLKMSDVENLRQIWEEDKEMNLIMVWLSSHGLTHHQSKAIAEQFGNNAKAILEANPYALISMIEGMGFKKIDEIARKMGVSKELPERIQAGIIFTIQENLNQGHCWTEYNDLINQVNILLVMDCLDSKMRIQAQMDSLLDAKIVIFPFNGTNCVALQDVKNTEDYLFQFFNPEEPNPHFEGPDSYLTNLNPALNSQQAQAVSSFLRYRISLISGGAGTGKTYTISEIINLCIENELSFALAAPTGKAAKVMDTATGQEAKTIHRLLEWQEGDFLRNENNPLTADVVIIDEVSMLDIWLAKSLFLAISNNTAVILVGDHNQLPPVGAGNILRDLLKYQIIPATLLTQVVRQSGSLKENSNAILNGVVMPTVANCKSDSQLSPWTIIKQKEPEQILKNIGNLFYNYFENYGLNLLQDIQLLTPTHKGILGTKNLNNCLQVLFQKKVYNRDITPTPEGREPVFYEGDKVIQTRNDYRLTTRDHCATEIMNGVIGTITGFGEEETMGKNGSPSGKFKPVIYVNFEGVEVIIPKQKNNLQLSYALTIHKSQGSQFTCVILIIHKSHSFQHHRNILYTGVTRAQKHAIIIGDQWGLKNCAQITKADNRRTFLSIFAVENIMKNQTKRLQATA